MEYRLRWVPGVGSLRWACTFHALGDANLTRRQPVFWWNMGFRLRRKRNLAKLMHTKSSLLENLDVRECTLNLRSTAKVNIKTASTAKTRVYNSPLYRGARLWNLLPADIQKEENKYVFKRKNNKHLFK